MVNDNNKVAHRSISQEWDSVEMDRYWRPVFDKYDRDRDGRIPMSELKFLLKSSDQLRHDFPDEVIEEVLEWADVNRDGVLTYDEFLRMLHARELGEARPMFQKIVRFAALAVVPKNRQAIIVRRYIEEYNCYPPPIFLLLISLIEVGIFIYYCVVFGELSAAGPVPVDSVLIYNPKRRYEAWRYLTYMFIHAGGVHIFFNLLIQLILGVPLEMVHKWWRIMLVYFGGVVAGSLGSSLSDPWTYLAGASGGVYALISAHLANVILNFKEMTFGWMRILFLTIFAGTDVGVALYARYVQDERSKTSYAAHFAGALAGLMIGMLCLRNLRVQRWESILSYCLFGGFIFLILFSVLWNILYTSYYPPVDYSPIKAF